MENEMETNGFVYYDNIYYNIDDAPNFIKRLNAIFDVRKDIDLALSGNVTYGNRGGELYYAYGDKVICSSNENLPAYCMFRSNNWRFAEHLENMGIPCFPSSTITRLCDDKMLAHSYLCDTVKMPDTIYELGHSEFSNSKSDFPVIIKATEGSYGKEVFWANDPAELLQSALTIAPEKKLIFQKPCPTGDDLRVYTMNGKVVKAILRKCAPREFKANLANNASAELYELNDEQKEVVEKVYEKLRLLGETGFICCDFLFDENGELVFNELNAVPGVKRLSELVSYDVVSTYLAYIERKCGVEVPQEIPEWVLEVSNSVAPGELSNRKKKR